MVVFKHKTLIEKRQWERKKRTKDIKLEREKESSEYTSDKMTLSRNDGTENGKKKKNERNRMDLLLIIKSFVGGLSIAAKNTDVGLFE